MIVISRCFNQSNMYLYVMQLNRFIHAVIHIRAKTKKKGQDVSVTCKVYYLLKANRGMKFIWLERWEGFHLVYLATDINSQEKWEARKIRKWARWVEVTAEKHPNTQTYRPRKGQSVIQGATVYQKNERAAFTTNKHWYWDEKYNDCRHRDGFPLLSRLFHLVK